MIFDLFLNEQNISFYFRIGLHGTYELETDVKITNLINDDPVIYQAHWMDRAKDIEEPIVVVERNEEPSEHEQKIYSTFKNHRRIIRTYGFVKNNRRKVMILQEQAPHGNLLSLLQSGQFQPSAAVLVEISLQIAKTMIEITHHGLIHGDLRCENIYVFRMHPTDPEKNSVKLANFALAQPKNASHDDNRRLPIAVRYCALEILRSAGHSNYSIWSDVYSMGVLMWQAFSQGKRPYDSSETNGEVRQRKLKEEKLPKPIFCPESIWSIIGNCWHNEPTVRYGFEHIVACLNTFDQQ